MAVLTIRNVPDEVRNRLRLRAAQSGRSMEAEVREILARASLETQETADPVKLQAWVDGLYGNSKPQGVVEDLIRERRQEVRMEQGTQT